ncbi:hypothetical protein ACIBCN_41435 [Nocardia sp. NPDC051052]|uniref:hypothetical protein n=1 Tax=Nocardia sp. NPDC051052 TaxID=3364322 RepID=UPI003796435D
MTALPLLGGVFESLDKFLLDLRFSMGWAETIEFLVLVVGLFLTLVVAFGRLIPWLATALLESADQWIIAVPAVLLAPEWLITRFLRKLGRPPGPIAYSYGDGVLVFADGTRVVATAVLRLIRSTGRVPRSIAAVLLVLGFLSWNSGTCVDHTAPCVSPVQQWVQVTADLKRL